MSFSNVNYEKVMNEAVKKSHCDQQLINSDYIPPPPLRPWILFRGITHTEAACILSITTYNVLSSSYASPKMYPYCPEVYLHWINRGRAIISEIAYYNSDVVCLQEVEMEQFSVFFLPLLRGYGYDGIYAPKSRARTMSYAKQRLVDGCAVFFKSEKFSLVGHDLVEFNNLAGKYYDERSASMLNRVMPRDNIGLFAILKPTAGAWINGIINPLEFDKLVVIAVTHLHWDPKFSDVKLMQTFLLTRAIMDKLEELSDLPIISGKKLNPSDIKLLLCGDFNSKPNSGVFEFLSTGRVPANHPDLLGLDYSATIANIFQRYSSAYIEHPLCLSSAINEHYMKYTNYTYDFKAMIDYIFYSTSNMELLGISGSISDAWFENNGIVGCPNRHIPSDHFPLIATFKI